MGRGRPVWTSWAHSGCNWTCPCTKVIIITIIKIRIMVILIRIIINISWHQCQYHVFVVINTIIITSMIILIMNHDYCRRRYLQDYRWKSPADCSEWAAVQLFKRFWPEGDLCWGLHPFSYLVRLKKEIPKKINQSGDIWDRHCPVGSAGQAAQSPSLHSSWWSL